MQRDEAKEREKILRHRKDSRWVDPESAELFEMLYGDAGPVVLSQAERVLYKFGGPCRLQKILKEVSPRTSGPATYYKWLEKGRIPSHAWDDLFAAAEYLGLVFEPEDFDPRKKEVSYSRASVLEYTPINKQKGPIL